MGGGGSGVEGDWCRGGAGGPLLRCSNAPGVNEGCCMQAPWLLMIETDYVWMKPLQAPSAEDIGAASLAFPFSYITPEHPSIQGVMRKMYPAGKGPLSDVPASGPAPAMMRLHEWKKVLLTSLLLE